MSSDYKKIVITNRKAFYNYEVIEQYESGIVLKGSEVKSLRESNASLQDSYCMINKGEMFVYNMHIAPYKYTGHFSLNQKRPRKLLLHKGEINRLFGRTTQRGLTIIPIEVFFNKDGKVKLTIGLAKSRKGPDQRDIIKKRDIQRELNKFGLHLK